MIENSSDIIEWHICENPSRDLSASNRRPIHMGPFSTEEECRAVLASLKQIPCFTHCTLELHRKYRRREKRIQIRLPVQVCRVSTAEQFWPAHTVDISTFGARLAGLNESVKLGEFIEIRCADRRAVFRVAWLGLPNTSTAGQLGVECLTPEVNLWDLDFSERCDDEPLLQEIVMAHAVQRKLFPRERPPLQTLDYEGRCTQARTVGGDYYDFLDLGQGRVGLVLADVAGKGVAAALLMANLQGSIHNRAAIDSHNLPALLSGVNNHLYKYTEPDRYATLFFGCYDDSSRMLHYANCGHLAPVLQRAGGTVERLGATATVLGLMEEWQCDLGETCVHPGDLLTIFTDGITETTTADGDEFGETRLVEVLRRNQTLELPAVVRNLELAVEQFRASTYLQDDLTLVVARGMPAV